MKPKFIFSALLCASFSTTSAAPIADPSDTIKMSPSAFTLQEVEVVGVTQVFHNQSVEKTNAELQHDNIGQGLPYLLQSTPALVATSDDGLGVGYSYYHLRGTDPTRIHVSINGVPLNDPESQTVFWVNLTDIAGDAQQLSVQRGVGSSTFGSSAFGAGIVLTTLGRRTLSGGRPVEVQAQFTGGMYRTFREMVSLYANIGQWHLSGRFSKVNSDGYVERAKSDLWSYQAEAGWQNAKTSVTLVTFGGKEKTYMAWYGIDETTLATNRRYNPAGIVTCISAQGDTTQQVYDNQTDNYRQHHVQLHWRQQFSEHWQLRMTGHYTYGNGFYEMADNGTYSEQTGWKGITQDGLTNHLGGGNVQAQYFHPQWTATVGMAAQYFTNRHWGKCDQANTYAGKGTKTEGNVYVKFTEYVFRKSNSHLALYEDVQYRLVDYRMQGTNEYTFLPLSLQRTWHFFNPKLGMVYKLQGHRLNLSFAMTHREPTRTNFLEADSLQSPRAERLLDTEIGYSYAFHAACSGVVGINLYGMYYHDQLIATGGLSRLSYTLLTNVAHSYRAGVECSYRLDFTRWLTWEGNLCWSRNQWKRTDQHWNTISFSPSWTAFNALDFHYAGFRGKMENQVVSSQYLDNTESRSARLKAYTITNLNLSYQLPLAKWSHHQAKNAWQGLPEVRIKCLINNLFNTKYCSNGGSADGYVWFYPQATINVYAGICVKW